jgi:hypothetical protein
MRLPVTSGVVVGGLMEGDSWVKVFSSDGELVSGVMLVGLCRGGDAAIDVVSELMDALSLDVLRPLIFVTSYS